MNARWSKDAIALEILHRYASNQPLNYGEMHRANLSLLRAAVRYFGSWKGAIEYAGLDYGKVRRYRIWTQERIVEQVCKYHREEQDLSWRHVSTKLDPPLAAAAVRGFGGWRQTLEAAGLDYGAIRRHRIWDAERVIEELRDRHAEGGSLRVSEAIVDDPALVSAARRHFEGWYEAVRAAGIDELEARLGVDGEYDEETARGEVSWVELQAGRVPANRAQD